MRQMIPETSPEFDSTRLIERPDGFYWQSRDGGAEFGPFATLLEAVHDMQARDEAAVEPGETAQEAEAEIGIADWVDPETGVPAEESVPRIEDK
jgi:hypothetical protein